jgi:hypothetical protein
MGRTVPSFRIALAMEKQEWKAFRKALKEQSDRKEFDDMFDIPRLYASACSNSVQLVPLHPIIMSILFHHYKELKECMKEVEQIETKVQTLPQRERVEVTPRTTTTLDSYYINKSVES